jgi:hypothetical protein
MFWAMNRQKIILSLLLIGCDIGALYSLGHTHSSWSFLFLSAVMIFAVIATTDWYTANDEQPPLPTSTPAPGKQTSG